MRRRFRLPSKGVLLAVALLVAVSEVELNANQLSSGLLVGEVNSDLIPKPAGESLRRGGDLCRAIRITTGRPARPAVASERLELA
jgi:hypothetical protein